MATIYLVELEKDTLSDYAWGAQTMWNNFFYSFQDRIRSIYWTFGIWQHWSKHFIYLFHTTHTIILCVGILLFSPLERWREKEMQALGGGVSRFSQGQSPGATLPTGTWGVVKHSPAGGYHPSAPAYYSPSGYWALVQESPMREQTTHKFERDLVKYSVLSSSGSWLIFKVTITASSS